MTWFKVDDGFESHPKLHALRERFPRSWRQAVCLWTLAGSWSAKHEQDGKIPVSLLSRFGATAKDAEALVSVGLWERLELDSYSVHDWLEYQPSSTQLRLERESGVERAKKSRESRKASAQHVECAALTRPVPSRPTKILTETSSNLGVCEEAKTALTHEPENEQSEQRSLAREIRRDFIAEYAKRRAAVPSENALGKTIPAVVSWCEASAPLRGVQPLTLWVSLCKAFFEAGAGRTRGYSPGFLAQDPTQWLDPAPEPKPVTAIRPKLGMAPVSSAEEFALDRAGGNDPW